MGGHQFDDLIYDCFKYIDLSLSSGKIYGIISEYGQGGTYLSYLLGSKIEFDDLCISLNEIS